MLLSLLSNKYEKRHLRGFLVTRWQSATRSWRNRITIFNSAPPNEMIVFALREFNSTAWFFPKVICLHQRPSAISFPAIPLPIPHSPFHPNPSNRCLEGKIWAQATRGAAVPFQNRKRDTPLACQSASPPRPFSLLTGDRPAAKRFTNLIGGWYKGWESQWDKSSNS